LNNLGESPGSQPPPQAASRPDIYWRVEGSLLDLGAVRPVAFFTSNAQSFSERSIRRLALIAVVLLRPLLYFIHREWATRVLHALLRGISQDRLDLLGEEYFEYDLKPLLKPSGIAKLKTTTEQVRQMNGRVILVSQGLDHVMKPLARHLGVEHLLANRMEFRDGLSTGRMLEPVVPPRRSLARLIGRKPDGRTPREWLIRELQLQKDPSQLGKSVFTTERDFVKLTHPLVQFDDLHADNQTPTQLSVHEALAGKHILLIGVTGFIAKVWLIHLLNKLPEIGRIYLLIRRQGKKTGVQRFEQIVRESPAFDVLFEKLGEGTNALLREKIEVVEGDVTQPDLGFAPDLKARLAAHLDLIANSAGLTDFNPDLRDALATNVDSAEHLINFQRDCAHAAMLHLSTCYVVGARDGRVAEVETPNYTPRHIANFDSEQEWHSLRELVRQAEERSESPAVTEELRQLVLGKKTSGPPVKDAALEKQIAKQRGRWLRNQLTVAGIMRARELGWPNTYTLTKSLGESLIASRGKDLPIAVVRPSIVESSLEEPFRGWNEGVNTSAPLSYLLGTYFRQLPTNERKCLDVIPVDIVCRGMTLISAALIERRHHRMYHLATSATNPCDMRRSIELTGLAHRKFYRTQKDFHSWLRLRFDTIPVSKRRYQAFSAPQQRKLIRAIQKTTPPLPFLKSNFARRERNLDRVEKIIELYEPFILLNDHLFEADNVETHSEALPENEKRDFSYDPRTVDWWDYWINVHVPAQRRWSYPLIEGRPLESRLHREFHMLEPGPEPEDSASANPLPERPVPTWPSS
jgi:nucleoside-diphosphate-sugar epimerase